MVDEQASAISLTEWDIERRKKIVGFDQEDAARVVFVKDVIAPRADEYTELFFTRLAAIGEASELLRRREALEQAKRLKREHLLATVGGDYGRSYVEQRVALGTLYSRHGLEARGFLGAFYHLQMTIGADILRESLGDPQEAFRRYLSVEKLAFFDIGIIVDVLVAERERTIGLQQESIRELSTPVLQVRDRLLILPIIGIMDSQRAKHLTDVLLRSIRANRARVVVMDITGAAAVDSKVANHLIQTVAAARLMGSTVIITGLSPEVAQALVALGVDLGRIRTTADLQDGLEQAERLLGYQVLRSDRSPSLLQDM